MKRFYAIIQMISYKYHRILAFLFGIPELEDHDNYPEIIKETFPKFYHKHKKS